MWWCAGGAFGIVHRTGCRCGALRNRDEIQRLLFEVREKFGQTIVMVTHDERLAEMADRKIVMSDGAIL